MALGRLKVIFNVFLIAWLSLAMVSAEPWYQSRIPNGNNVPNPCDPSKPWAGVGHENPAGIGSPSNVFGTDFYRHNKQWTPSLCRTDSDGDGMTNGQELGDPDCVWSSGALPAVRDRTQLSHPGICEPINSARCIGRNLFLAQYCPDFKPPTTTNGPIVYCEMPMTPTNAFVVNSSPSHGNQFVPGDFVQFDCTRGFKMTGTPTVYCQRNRAWTMRPECKVPSVIAVSQMCQGLLTPANGVIVRTTSQQTGRMFASGDLVEFGCRSGYTLVGDRTLTCQSNGTWTDDLPVCIQNTVIPVRQNQTTCPAPRSPTNGFVSNKTPLQTFNEYAVGEVLKFACNPRYSISSRSGIQCQVDGTWFPGIPTCIPKIRGPPLHRVCPMPTLPEKVHIRNIAEEDNNPSTLFAIGDVLELGCSEGYVMSPMYPVIQCLPHGEWSPNTTPSCRQNVRIPAGSFCPPPDAPENGQILGGRSPAADGDTNYGYYSPGDVVQFICMEGYDLFGDPVVTCQRNGAWLGSQLPTCNRKPLVDTSVFCTSPRLARNAVIRSQSRQFEPGKYIIGSFLLFGCMTGYDPSGKATRICTKDGSWTTSNFRCLLKPSPPAPEVTCRAPVPPDHAYIFASSPSLGNNTSQMGRYRVGDFIQYACMDGFASDDRPTTQCQQSGIFSPRVSLTCRRLVRPIDSAASCISPAIAVDAYVVQVTPVQIGNRYSVGQSIQYACRNGFSTSDTTVLQCLRGGSWSSNLPECLPNSRLSGTSNPCAPPPVPGNAFIMNAPPTRTYRAGDVIQYGCNQGHNPVGTSNRATCQNDGSWTSIQFVCQRRVRVAVTITTCDPPMVPRNGYMVARAISLIGQRYSPNDYVQYACNGGYIMAGNSTNVCDRNGSWSGLPNCVRVEEPSKK